MNYVAPPPKAQQLREGQGLHIIEASLSPSDTPHSVKLLRTSDQPVAVTFTSKHTAITREKYPCPDGIRTSQSKQVSGRTPSP